MKDALFDISIMLIFASAIAFITGLFLLFIENKRKFAVKLLIGSVIIFLIGFGACFATFSIGPMH